MKKFNEERRQKYIDEESFRNTLKHFEDEKFVIEETLSQPESYTGAHAEGFYFYALSKWDRFEIRFTSGEDLRSLASSLDEVIEAFDKYVSKNNEIPEQKRSSAFRMVDIIDTYITYLHLLCISILLHREDLLPKIFEWIKDGEYDGADAILEELLNFYFPDRPSPDEWLWRKPYEKLIDVIDAPSFSDRPKLMKKYVKSWYPAMKGQAGFWGAHEKIKPEYSPYFGYWAMCAGAFTYLFNIDDTSYRNEETYPKDLVDYARSMSRRPIKLGDGTEVLRVEGGQACPKEGKWFSPAKENSARHFEIGEIMPIFDRSEFGQTIWQLAGNND